MNLDSLQDTPLLVVGAGVKLDMNCPKGLSGWVHGWDAAALIALLDALDAHYCGERYRVRPGLRLRAWGQS